MKGRLGWSGMKRCGGFCRGGRPCCRLDLLECELRPIVKESVSDILKAIMRTTIDIDDRLIRQAMPQWSFHQEGRCRGRTAIAGADPRSRLNPATATSCLGWES